MLGNESVNPLAEILVPTLGKYARLLASIKNGETVDIAVVMTTSPELLIFGCPSVRQEQIDRNVKDVMHAMLDEANEWVIPEGTSLGPAPEWHELREAIQKWFFLMERECERLEEEDCDYDTVADAEVYYDRGQCPQ